MQTVHKLLNRRLAVSFKAYGACGFSTTVNYAQEAKNEIPSVRPPNIDELYDISEKFGLNIPYEELSTYKDCMKGMLESFDRVDKFPEINPPVKYPRTGAYRPSAEENDHNAWYVKCDIKGAKGGPLEGKTIAVKDNIAVAGLPMMNGARMLEGYVPEYDATVVNRVLDAGGRILGKSACEYLCMSGNSHTCASGPILNPHNRDRSAGGSSGGSAVLVSLKEVDMAIGGDQGGSIRLPSCWSGCIGLKPTFGLVPYTGAFPIAKYVDHLGPMASTVEEVALLLEVLAGSDGMDCRQPSEISKVKYTKELKKGFADLKVGIMKEGFEECEEDVEEIVKSAAFNLKNMGLNVSEVSVPLHKSGGDIWSSVGVPGVYHQLLHNAGITTGSFGHQPTTMHDYVAKRMKTNGGDLSPTVKLFWLFGEHMKRNYELHHFCKGSNIVPHLKKAYNDALSKYDILITPTIKYKAPLLPTQSASTEHVIKESLGMIANTTPFNITWHPALSINVGFSENLPIGMQIIGRHFEEATVLRAALAVEQMIKN
ncbi:DgyrCDS7724 [Dimorphilus gyrociliatus]|uniref:DgyrCDS7724 n=1 Tax=Dimorphilus gyrociliatus TaxID=2664684 RepID=A0A7I8VS06_9ANNE|nr:DgyrCDS7724 [Dimorphilus gyrociliatus]